MIARIFLFGVVSFLAITQNAAAQAIKPYRIGVILPGGPLYGVLEGTREGLRELGLREEKQFKLTIRETQSDVRVAEETARYFETEKFDLIYALATPTITAAQAATAKLPIVFCIGSDPVAAGLVKGFAKPGGRLTGVHFLVRDLTAKRLEVLKEIIPKLGRVVTYYDPGNRVSADGAALAREEAKRLGINLIERHVASVEELRDELQSLKAGDTDGFLFSPDPRVGGQSQLIIETAKAKRLPTMFHEQNLVAKGALASYGQNYHEIGRLLAKYIQRVLNGADPKDMKIETVETVELAINLKTAKELGVGIPPQVLARAKKVIK